VTSDEDNSVLILRPRPLTKRGFWDFAGKLALFSAVAFGLIYLVFRNGPRVSSLDAAVGVGSWAFLCGSLLALIGLVIWLAPREIRIDDQGVTHTSSRGRITSLVWKDVEQVRWTEWETALRSSSTFLRVNWSYFDDPARSAARRRVEAILSCNFDLTDQGIPDPLDRIKAPALRSNLKDARVVAHVLAWGFVWFAVPLSWAVWFAPWHWLITPEAVKLWFLSMLCWGAMIAGYGRFLYPAWRTRRVKTPVAEL
jgi:hypothetical protein